MWWWHLGALGEWDLVGPRGLFLSPHPPCALDLMDSWRPLCVLYLLSSSDLF